MSEAAKALVVRRQSSLARVAKAAKAAGRGGASHGESLRALEAALREAAAARTACFTTAAALDAAVEGGRGSGHVAAIAGCESYDASLRAFETTP